MVCLVVFSRPARTRTPLNQALCPQLLQPRKSRIQLMHAANSTSRGRCTPSCRVRFTIHLQRHIALRQITADLQSMSNIFCRDVLTFRCRQRHNLLCRRIHLQQIKHFTARVGSDMILADSSVVCCVSGLFCPTFSAVPIKDLHCCVCRSSKTSVPSCEPLFIVFESSVTRMLFVCSSCFLPTKPNSSAKASVHIGS